MIEIGLIRADIRFDAGTVERLFAAPETVLEDVEGFWEREEPMRHARGWHEAVGVPVDLDQFRSILRDIASLSPSERVLHPALQMTRRVVDQERRFLSEGLPHLCSLLPELPATLDIRILFARGLRTNAFAHEQVVVNATSRFWHVPDLSLDERASWVLNLLVHECWHGGYSRNQPRWSEQPQEDKALQKLLANIQDEGIATYVNYTARTIFPARADQDFRMLEDPSEVMRKLEAMNAILEKRHILGEAALLDLAWSEGVVGRAFYVSGAHMARVIDERCGRLALTDTVARGPRSFLETYNAVADVDQRVEVLPV